MGLRALFSDLNCFYQDSFPPVISQLRLQFLPPRGRASFIGKLRVRISVEFIKMEVLRIHFFAMAILALALALVVPSTNAQSLAPAPAPTSDGMAVDQGIAYVLMLLALVLTYIIH